MLQSIKLSDRVIEEGGMRSASCALQDRKPPTADPTQRFLASGRSLCGGELVSADHV